MSYLCRPARLGGGLFSSLARACWMPIFGCEWLSPRLLSLAGGDTTRRMSNCFWGASLQPYGCSSFSIVFSDAFSSSFLNLGDSLLPLSGWIDWIRIGDSSWEPVCLGIFTMRSCFTPDFSRVACGLRLPFGSRGMPCMSSQRSVVSSWVFRRSSSSRWDSVVPTWTSFVGRGCRWKLRSRLSFSYISLFNSTLASALIPFLS